MFFWDWDVFWFCYDSTFLDSCWETQEGVRMEHGSKDKKNCTDYCMHS